MLKPRLEKDEIGPPYERCCICREPTPYWLAEVAICPKCAKYAKREDIPDKKTWCRREEIASGEPI